MLRLAWARRRRRPGVPWQIWTRGEGLEEERGGREEGRWPFCEIQRSHNLLIVLAINGKWLREASSLLSSLELQASRIVKMPA